MTSHAQTTQRAERRAAAAPLDYSGRRHARITRSMKTLPRAVLQILTELRYSIRDGETHAISNRVLAERTGLYEGYVSAIVRWLAGECSSYYRQFAQPPQHIFITRRPRSDGLPGFETTMLVPPELRPRPSASSHKARANICPTARPDTAAQCAEPSFPGDHGSDPLIATTHTAPECDKTPQNGDHWHDPPLLFMHTVNESTNQESTPDVVGGGGGAPAVIEEALPAAPADTPTAPPALQTIPPACDENHQGQLAPELIAGHQALNPDRAIFPGEWWELLEMQATHGTEKLLLWQARAARRAEGAPSRVLPGYYRTCAARAAVDAYRPRRGEAAPERVSAPLSPPALASPAPAPAPRPQLDPACEQRLRQIGIRERQALAGVPLALIEQWARVLDHPGLAARFDDVRAFAHSQLRLQQPPPARAELDRWAERARSRAAAAPPPALTDAQAVAIRERHTALETRAAAIAPPDLTKDERLALMADLERGMTDAEVLERLHERRAVVPAPEPTPEQICLAILEQLRQPIHRALWPLLDRVTFVLESETLRIVCERVADLGIVEGQLAMHIRSALRAYTWQPSVRVVAQAPPITPPTPEPAPPAWIAPERWESLPGLLKTMLLGSTLQDGALRCVSPGLTTQVQSRYGDLLAALLVERHEEAGDATR